MKIRNFLIKFKWYRKLVAYEISLYITAILPNQEPEEIENHVTKYVKSIK